MTEKKIGTYEWRPGRFNCIYGCRNNCRYCYAKGKAIQYKRETADTWPVEHPNLKARAHKFRGGVMFPTSHDLHYDHLDWWFPHLRKLLTLGNDVLVVTKAEFKTISTLCSVFDTDHAKSLIEFRFTIGTDDEVVREYWEPGAPSIQERINSLKFAHDKGFKTSLSMEPLLMENPAPFINSLKPWITGEIWIGKMNHFALKPEIPEHARQIQIQSKDNLEQVWLLTSHDPQVRYKDTMRELLGLG